MQAAPALGFSMATPSPESRAMDEMLLALNEYRLNMIPVPAPPNPLPSSILSLVSLVTRAVGLGERAGTDVSGPFSVGVLKGLLLEAVVRYQVWTTNPGDADSAIQDLIKRLLGDRDKLRKAGFKSIALKNTGTSEIVFVPDPAWRESVEFELLYEFQYTDSDDTYSLISQIPIGVDSEFNESTVVTDEMTRWDEESAPALVLRGRLNIARLSALDFITGAGPDGPVTITRTFEGAVGLPVDHADLDEFLAAITNPNNPERHAKVTFASLQLFLDKLPKSGNAITMKDDAEAPHDYESRALLIDPPIELPGADDRLEITSEFVLPAPVFVVYLRATGDLAS